jgi:hypothetical protein
MVACGVVDFEGRKHLQVALALLAVSMLVPNILQRVDVPFLFCNECRLCLHASRVKLDYFQPYYSAIMLPANCRRRLRVHTSGRLQIPAPAGEGRVAFQFSAPPLVLGANRCARRHPSRAPVVSLNLIHCGSVVILRARARAPEAYVMLLARGRFHQTKRPPTHSRVCSKTAEAEI